MEGEREIGFGKPSVDLDAYDIDGLRSDVMDLVDLPVALVDTARRAVLGPVVVGLFSWLYFAGSMAWWARLPFTLIAVVLSLITSVLVAVYLVMQRRVEAAVETSSRVLDSVALAKGDIERLAAGGVSLSVRDLSVEILDSAVFPGMEDAVVQVVPFPLRFLARPLLWVPRQVVGRTVLAAVERLPIQRLDREAVADGSHDGHAERADAFGRAVDSFVDDIAAAQAGLERTVAAVLRTVRKPLVVTMFLTAVPLVLWLLLGDVVAS